MNSAMPFAGPGGYQVVWLQQEIPAISQLQHQHFDVLILDNAVRYSSAPDNVLVDLSADERVMLTIADAGVDLLKETTFLSPQEPLQALTLTRRRFLFAYL